MMKKLGLNRFVTVFVLLIVFTFNGMASSKIGEVKIDVGTTKTVLLNSAYLNTLRYSGTRIMSYSWSSSNSNITISSQSAEQAVIKGVKTGTALLNYKCSYVIDNNYRSFDFYYEVTISGDLVVEADISFETPFLFLDEGESYTINAIQSGVAGGVYFTTDDPQVATVEGGVQDGWKTPVTVTAVGVGVTNIYANTLRGLVSSCKVTVKPIPVPATEISLPESEMLQQGQEIQLTAIVSPDNSTSQKTWNSDNTDVAVVSTDGLVTALAEGIANITVLTDNGLSATCCITVLPKSKPIAYAVLEHGVLTFYYDENKDSRESTFYDENNELIKAGGVFELDEEFSGFPSECWLPDRIISEVDEYGRTREQRIAGEYFTTVVAVFDSSFAAYKPEITKNLFKYLVALDTIKNLDYLNTSDVLDMSGMFFGCSSLKALDLSTFDTSNVTSMSEMFSGCSSLTTIYVGEKWQQGKVEGDGMFDNCSKLLGEKGTTFHPEHTGFEYAHVDGGDGNPGYFTLKNGNNETSQSIAITPMTTLQPFCSEKGLNFSMVDGLTAYIAIGYNPSLNEIMLSPVKEVPAGTGVLLKGNVGKTYSVPICSSNYKYNNSLVGVLQNTKISNGYVFDDSFKLVSSETIIPANTAYLLLPYATETGVSNVKLNMVGGSSVKGDANGDGMVDITDVVITVNLILGN